MLPRSTHSRTSRTPGGRGKEIQRLIGRSLRAAVDLSALGERTITVDCDVIQADGGTRVAAITGGYIAVALAVNRLKSRGAIAADVQVCTEQIAAISVGIVDGEARLDLPYEEDSKAAVDMNIVMTGDLRLIEVQGTAESEPFTRDQLNQLVDLASTGIKSLCAAQSEVISRGQG